MPRVTTNVDDESAIQYQGVEDKSSMLGAIRSVGAIVGYFKRGKVGELFTVTKGNVKAVLGYEPNNPYYRIVQDALDNGLPSVLVLRLPDQVVSN